MVKDWTWSQFCALFPSLDIAQCTILRVEDLDILLFTPNRSSTDLISQLNLDREWKWAKGFAKLIQKSKKSNYEVLSLLIPHLRIKCRHGEPVSHTNAMLALSTMFTVIKMFGLLPMFAKMFNTLCKRTPLPHPQSFHCLNPNVVFSPQKGNPG